MPPRIIVRKEECFYFLGVFLAVGFLGFWSAFCLFYRELQGWQKCFQRFSFVVQKDPGKDGPGGGENAKLHRIYLQTATSPIFGRCYVVFVRKIQEGCGGLGGENPGAFPNSGPTFQRPFCLPESAQILAGIACCTAGKSGRNFPAASNFAGNPSTKEFRRTTDFSL